MLLSSEIIFAITLAINASLFVASYKIVLKNDTKKIIIESGETLLRAKKKMSQKRMFQWLFSRLELNKPIIPQLLLSSMIFLKSIGMFLVGTLLISPLVMIIQGAMMGSLKTVLQKDELPVLFDRVLYAQLLGHVTATSMGLVFGYSLWVLDQSWMSTLRSSMPLILISAGLILFSAIFTAHLECKMIRLTKISLIS